MLQNGIIYKIQTDTYKQEIERYDSQVMQLTEDLFYHGSEATVSFLMLLGDDNAEKYRGLFIMAGVLALLDDFGFSPERSKHLLQALQQSSLAEHSDPGFVKRQLDEKYRKDRRSLEEILDANAGQTWMGGQIRDILTERSNRNRPVVEKILSNVSITESRIEELLSSYIHLSVNRLFVSNPRLHELVVYHYLYKHMASQLAMLHR